MNDIALRKSVGGLVEEQVMRKFGNSEFSTKPTHYYNLEVLN